MDNYLPPVGGWHPGPAPNPYVRGGVKGWVILPYLGTSISLRFPRCSSFVPKYFSVSNAQPRLEGSSLTFLLMNLPS